MYGPLKLAHHQHSGRLRPHEHTSYLPLAFLLLLVGATLLRFTFPVNADTPYTGPGYGSIGLTGTVPEPPPNVAATITTPKDQQRFTATPITVAGTCPSGDLVEIFKNDIFAGSTPCSSGNFSLEIDLLFGQNSLTAQVYDILNQAGPVSKAVTVYYDTALPIAAAPSSLNFAGSQLILNSDAAYRGVSPGQPLNVPITVLGGTPPFAVNVEWGDTNNQLISQSSNSTFNATHTYQKPGTYKITIQATDSKGLVAYLTVVAVVNGTPDILSTASNASHISTNKLLVLWPVYAIAATMVISFWLGERREKHLLGADNKNPDPPGFGVTAHNVNTGAQ